jgi:hypothetical protein
MERTKWTDERLDDRFGTLDTTLARVEERLDRDMRELRAEMRTGFAEQRQLMYRLFGGLFVALVVSTLFHNGI